MEKYYTIAEMSKLLKVPESTIRYYRDRFSQYIPFTGEGRKKRYPTQSLEVLRIIAEESNRNATAEEIESRLSVGFTSFIEIQEETAITSAATQQQLNLVPFESFLAISKSLETIIDKLSLVEKQQLIIEEQQKRIENLEKQNKKIDVLQAKIEDLIQAQQTAEQPQDKIFLLESPKQTKAWWKFWS